MKYVIFANCFTKVNTTVNSRHSSNYDRHLAAPVQTTDLAFCITKLLVEVFDLDEAFVKDSERSIILTVYSGYAIWSLTLTFACVRPNINNAHQYHELIYDSVM